MQSVYFGCINYHWMLILVFVTLLACKEKQHETVYASSSDWSVSLGTKASSQYSSLNQINTENIQNLELAWTYRTGDIEEGKNTQIQCNPIIINGVLFATTPTQKAIALNAANGKRIWEFDPHQHYKLGVAVNRGVTFWQSGEDRRILYSVGSYLFALNADTGELVRDFGNNGSVSLKTGLGDWAQNLFVISTSPGIIYKDKIIIGTRVSENNDAAPGFIRAFNVRTGEVDWVFHTIPRPGEFGYDTWPEDAYERVGGANNWSGMSLDESRGVVYIPTGSASFDFWGGNRLGDNLFANSIIALDADQGERIWHYQTIRHDMWDRDLPAPPNLVSVNHEGKKIDALAQVTKTGRVFLLDRDSGEPLFPIEEIEVPESDLIGEETAKSQPLPTLPPPFSRQVFTEEVITDISPEATAYVKEKIKGLKYGHMFMPPSTEGTIIYPGFDGGAEWGGSAFDPNTGFLYVNANEMPWILTMVPTMDLEGATLGKSAYLAHCVMCHGQDLKGDTAGDYPSLLGVEERYSKEEIHAILANGKGRMPGFKHVKEEQREAIVAFLLDEKAEGPSQDLHEQGMESNLISVPYTHTGYNRFFDEDGYPAVKPPWGTLNAIDLNKGEIAWQVPLGEFEELSKKGVPKTGTENYGGPVVTDGGLLFIGASQDEYFRVFDKNTGEELWKYKLPAGGYATPATYAIDGEQFVVIAAGGGKMGTKSGDYYVAFKLKNK
ncbi:outer membrane protein assembly factor BamB family protein [Pleomorphovibrio marinus]|uniref:outer membrane protein assembly factor BamB family protein n=1 Tax=Pleomorphovibrio marinus TaxID=2164132 RepID=UPI001E403A69|nr:PQQ-binding-like beta-propeller repeat protein [Pleomorphovibrio marinus]